MSSEILSQNALMAIPKLVANVALPAVVGTLVMGNLVNRDYENTIAQAGDVVNVPIAPNLVANNIAEAGSVQNQNKSLGNAAIVLNRHLEASFSIPDVTQIFTRPDLVATYMQSAIIAAAEQVETDILNTFAQLNFNASVGTSNTPLTEAVLDSAETALFAAKVPAGIPKYLVVSGTAYGQLRTISRFSEVQTAGLGLNSPSPILTGTILQAKGFNVFRSQYVNKTGNTTNNIGFVRDALALVIRMLPITQPGMGVLQAHQEYGGFGFRTSLSYVPGQLECQFTVDCLYGTGVLRNNFGQLVLS